VKLEVISKFASSNAHAVPLLFIHGAWHAAWCWDVHFLDFFARNGFHAHALSLRGHGESEGREGLRRARISDYVADVAVVAAGLPSAPILVGHSMGGFVVQKYLERHSAPAGVLLASVPPTGSFRMTVRLARRHPLVLAKAASSLSLFPIVSTPALAREAFFSEGVSEEETLAFNRRLQEESIKAFLDMLWFDLPVPERVKSHMLVFGGERDSLLSPAEIEATARAYKTRAQLFAGVAHDMMLELKWPEVARGILKEIIEVVHHN
jgi:pimeloyl-ACP methyl ester carboxylesterase